VVYESISWAMLALGFASALAILVDELVLGHRQHMAVMNLVHPITALYWGPVWLWAYCTHGRKGSHAYARAEAERLLRESGDPHAEAAELRERAESSDDLRPWHVANAVSHCGAGCTLGDIAAEWLVLTLGIAWFGKWSGHTLPEELLLDFLFAWSFGIAFQYFTGAGTILGAIRVDTASIVAFQAGLFGWMAIVMLVIWPHHGIRIDSAGFWFQMQVGMILGYATAWPVNRLLVRRGIKEKMDHRRHVAMLLEQLADERAPERAYARRAT
jgi:hypothetical protein